MRDQEARCFDAGEHGNFVLFPISNERLRQILPWGVANIAEPPGGLTARIGLDSL